MDERIKKKTIKALKGRKSYKKELRNKLSDEEVEIIWKESHRKLAKMLEKYANIPEGVKTHTDNSISFSATMMLMLMEVFRDLSSQELRPLAQVERFVILIWN